MVKIFSKKFDFECPNAKKIQQLKSEGKTSRTLTTEYTFNKYLPERSIKLSRMKVRQEPPALLGYHGKQGGYEKNGELLPTAISRNSMRIVWWKCVSGHSWRAKITDRTLEGKGCYLCEREFQSVFPQLLIMLYAVRNGLKVATDTDNIIGINLDAYVPELRLAIEAEATTVTEQRHQMVKEHICECNGIRYVKIKNTPDLIKTAQAIKEAFRKCHTFFTSNDDEDIELLRKRFLNWRKQS